MDVIHFTHGATDMLLSFGSSGARFLPLADGAGDTHVSCLHLEEGGRISAPSITHAATLLVVHGRIVLCPEASGARIDIAAGVGAILLIVESSELTPHARGISSPERIAGATWPGDVPSYSRPAVVGDR